MASGKQRTNSVFVNVVRYSPEAALPVYATAGAAGADLAYCGERPLPVKPGTVVRVMTGISMEIPPGYEGQIRARSGLATRGLIVANAPGTIDSDYRGEIVILVSSLAKTVRINPGERIAQLVIAPVFRAAFKDVYALSETERGTGGLGSTGSEALAEEDVEEDEQQ